MTVVNRKTSCILGWAVDLEREKETLQGILDDAPQATYYFSDLFATYRNLIYYPGRYTPMPDKSETYHVEGDNAEFRHYLARLARRSLCFSRCIHALRAAIKLFVFAWNSRQLYKTRYPNHPAHLKDLI